MGITKARIIGFLMTAVLALSAPVVYADYGNGGNFGDGHGGRQGHYMKGKFFHKLNLTDVQKKQMKDIWQKQREAKKATFEQIKANREALNKELAQPTSDMAKINALQAQLKTLVLKMADSRLNSTLEVKKVLTPEQFGKYLEFQKHKFAGRSHKGEWGQGKGCHRHGGNWRHCRHHRHHHGYKGQYGDGYGEHHGHGYENGDND